MYWENVPSEVASDLITLVNSLGTLEKTSEVRYGTTNFKYVPLDDILGKIKENKNFAFMQPLGTMDDGSQCIQCVLIHKSGHTIVSDPYKLKVKDGGKKQDEGAEITYSRRYCAASFLGIASDEDTDAQGEEEYSKSKASSISKSSNKRQSTNKAATNATSDPETNKRETLLLKFKEIANKKAADGFDVKKIWDVIAQENGGDTSYQNIKDVAKLEKIIEIVSNL